MKRRQFITLLGCAVAAWPLAARATAGGQASARRHSLLRWNENIAAFLQGSRDGGHIDGQSAIIEAR